MKKSNRKIFCRMAAVFSVMILLPLLVACAPTGMDARPAAVLHEEDEFGYIPDAETWIDAKIKAPQAFVYDCGSGEIVYLKGNDRVLYPASTTKLLTILCALDYLEPEEFLRAGEELDLVPAGSSIAYIRPGHVLTAEMLVEGMLLPSGNDAAYVLAAAAGRKIAGDPGLSGEEAIGTFMKAMENDAKRLGLVGTSFVTPDGFAGKDHYSTLEDMILICREAVKNEVIMRYAGLDAADVTYASGHTNHWENTNRLVCRGDKYYRPEVTGLKTGSLDGSYSLIVTAEKSGRTVIVGLFGEIDKDARFDDACKLLDAIDAFDAPGGKE